MQKKSHWLTRCSAQVEAQILISAIKIINIYGVEPRI